MTLVFDRSSAALAAWLVLSIACGGETAPEDRPDATTERPDAGDATDAGVVERPLAPVWTRQGGPPPSDPAGRWAMRPVVATDIARMFVFGGSTYPVGRSVGDFWALDLSDDTWTEMPIAGAPSPRYCYCAAYLPTTREVLIVGGRNDDGPTRPGAWTFDTVSGMWRSVDGPGFPTGVVGCGAVWVPDRSHVVVFGGGARRYDLATRTYDPTNRSFTRVETATVGPPGRQDAMMAYDPGDGGRVLLFGGASRVFPPEEAILLDDMWSFDGTTWRELEISGARPAPRRFSADAFDEARREWILFGGTREVADFDDLWHFDAVTDRWTELTADAPDGLPSARGFAALAFDPTTENYRMFGGLQLPDFRALDDSWTLTLRP